MVGGVEPVFAQQGLDPRAVGGRDVGDHQVLVGGESEITAVHEGDPRWPWWRALAAEFDEDAMAA